MEINPLYMLCQCNYIDFLFTYIHLSKRIIISKQFIQEAIAHFIIMTEFSCEPGQSLRGLLRRLKYFSKVPAHASLLVKKLELRLKSFLTVAGIEECSNCEDEVGPLGPWITASNNRVQIHVIIYTLYFGSKLRQSESKTTLK